MQQQVLQHLLQAKLQVPEPHAQGLIPPHWGKLPSAKHACLHWEYCQSLACFLHVVPLLPVTDDTQLWLRVAQLLLHMSGNFMFWL